MKMNYLYKKRVSDSKVLSGEVNRIKKIHISIYDIGVKTHDFFNFLFDRL